MTKAEKKVTAEKKERKPRAPGVGTLIKEGLLAGKTTEEILADVRAAFPESKAVGATVSWYRGKLRTEGKLEALEA